MRHGIEEKRKILNLQSKYENGEILEADLTDTVNPDTNRVTKNATVTCTGTNAKINPTTAPANNANKKLALHNIHDHGI